jgi:hypothetical protein
MIRTLIHRWFLRGLIALTAVAVLLALGVAAYAARFRASATALIDSAWNIRTTADAQRELDAWRRRGGQRFWQESDHFGDHAYDGQIENLSIARLWFVEPTAVTLGVTMRGGELRNVALMVQTGRQTAAVWIQEWFESDLSGRIHVTTKDKPWKSVIEFSASVPEAQRKLAFAVNPVCFDLVGRCKTAEDILPAIWWLDTTHR